MIIEVFEWILTLESISLMILVNPRQRSRNTPTTFPKYTDRVFVLSGQGTLSQRDKNHQLPLFNPQKASYT